VLLPKLMRSPPYSPTRTFTTRAPMGSAVL
jgi:hypothetical protein